MRLVKIERASIYTALFPNHLNSFIQQSTDTKISFDFLLDKANLTQFELASRFKHFGNIFHDGPAQPQPQEESGGTPSVDLLRDFATRINHLRSLVCDLLLARLHKIFKDRSKLLCGNDYPHCETLPQWLEEYKNGPYDNKKRGMVHTLCSKLWGKECIPLVEKLVMTKLGLKYISFIIDKDGNLVCPKTNRRIGCVGKMGRRITQSFFTEAFR
jgi:hypothetical protein